MSSDYFLSHPDTLLSPSLVIFRPIVRQNLAAILKMAGSPDRLRPHCKTHKMPAVVKMQLEAGITRHKAATIAEVEMLAETGVRDIVLGYPPIGPNIQRVVQLKQKYPGLKLGVTADHPAPLKALSDALVAAGIELDVYMDINPGRDRTGLKPGPEAAAFYRQIAATPNVRAAGFHVYDGHFGQSDPAERRAAIEASFHPVQALRDQLVQEGFAVEKLICGGTPTFPIFSTFDDPTIELSPGTCVFHDTNYGEKYPDLSDFKPAALLFTRVISRPTPNRVTLDLGSKSVASDPPMGQRVSFEAIPDGVQVLHNEEHLVIETDKADQFVPGDWMLGIPRHVCPCSALHKEAYVIENGELVDVWAAIGRDRKLTI